MLSIVKWQTILVILGFGALILIGYLNWDEVVRAISVIRTSTWPILLAIPVVQIFSFYANTRYYQSFFDVFGYRVKLGRLYKLSLALNFINQLLPSVGVSAISFMSYSLKGTVPAGKAALVQWGRYALTFISFMALLLLGTLLIYFGGGIDKITVRIIIMAVVAALIMAVVVLYIVTHKESLSALAHWLQRFIDRVGGWFRKGKPLIGEKAIKHLLVEFHEGFEFIIKERRKLLWPFFYALMGNVMEIATLYVVFLALGFSINIGAIIIAYAAANAAGVISFIPGDVGVYEVTMVAAFSSLGIPVSIGLSATLLYRIINKGIFLPIGFFCYSDLLGKAKRAGLKQINAG